jgi:hypothetical protein
MTMNIIRQTGGSVNVGDSYVYDFITRDAGGRLQLWSQECVVNEDGYIEGLDDARDYTNSIDAGRLAEWAEYWTLDTRHGDPADCLVPEGSTLVGHRLHREGE